jgi:hypothetical protein
LLAKIAATQVELAEAMGTIDVLPVFHTSAD